MGGMEEHLGGPKPQESQGRRIRGKNLDPSKRASYRGGVKPLKRRHKAREGFVGKRRSGGIEGKPLMDHPVEESSEGAKPRSVGSWKRLSRACGAKGVERVAKP